MWTKNKVIRINIFFIISYLISAIYEDEMEGLFTGNGWKAEMKLEMESESETTFVSLLFDQ